MKRDKLHHWLMTNCPAYKSLAPERQVLLVDQALIDEAESVRRERRQDLITIGVVTVIGLLLFPFTGQLPLGYALFGVLMLCAAGVSHYRVASRIELRVRQAAMEQAVRLSSLQSEKV